MGKRQITILMDEELLAAIDIQSEKLGMSRADYIRMAVIERLRRNSKGG